MTRLCSERGALKHDDRIDVLAIAVAYWVESMARNAEDDFKAHEQAIFDEELERFMQNQLTGVINSTRGVQTPDPSTDFINTGFMR